MLRINQSVYVNVNSVSLV
uniref:Uncharacterized protein n=1 Tax=Medicago truncatula TaxID=3880 RepID=B7FFG7_MEDTR|nr:unknown [Medicago truncatula]